ncbi:hypothetical protein ACN20G_23580 [Streptomyces sp. BI20]|uniref:hypothetical protein n=1 Tax=Streptomyces sp. BI20 TaxID=3403460 RepID=UPI003C76C34B
MIETSQKYQRDKTRIHVIHDDGAISRVYLGIETPEYAAEVNLDQRDIPKLIAMLSVTLTNR